MKTASIVVMAVSMVLLISSLIFLAVNSGGGSCPKGKTLGVVTYYPQTIGSAVVMEPIYGCVEG